MKIMNKLKIGSHNYRVICPYKFKERGDLSGQHDSALLEIRINPHDSWSGELKPDSRIKTTVMHEILHAIDAFAGNPLKAAGDSQEHIVEAFSEGLCQVFADNKKLLHVFKKR